MSPEPRILTVSELSTFLNDLIAPYPVAVTGEVAGFSVSQGKFVFFDLKDEVQDARLACFCMLTQLNVPVENGMRVVLHARPAVFRKSGKLSLTVVQVQPVGEGSLQRAFELLKAKLEKEGLFAQSRKRPLPELPQHVGVITSQDAAGWGDFWRVLQERGPRIKVSLTPSSVQGARAVDELCAALAHMNTYIQPEVIVLVRGGGSIEDLHAFNDERLARALAASRVPVLVGVGHERDVTIADLVSDMRAPTPTAAAQLVLPDRVVLQQRIDQLGTRIGASLGGVVLSIRHSLARSAQFMSHSLVAAYVATYRRLAWAEERITARSPKTLLANGYTITTASGMLVRSRAQAQGAATLETHFPDGSIMSTPHA